MKRRKCDILLLLGVMSYPGAINNMLLSSFLHSYTNVIVDYYGMRLEVGGDANVLQIEGASNMNG